MHVWCFHHNRSKTVKKSENQVIVLVVIVLISTVEVLCFVINDSPGYNLHPVLKVMYLKGRLKKQGKKGYGDSVVGGSSFIQRSCQRPDYVSHDRPAINVCFFF